MSSLEFLSYKSTARTTIARFRRHSIVYTVELHSRYSLVSWGDPEDVVFTLRFPTETPANLSTADREQALLREVEAAFETVRLSDGA